MAQQQGHRVHRWGHELHWETFDRPVPAEGEVLIKVEACGIGLTVLNTMAGDLANDPALLPRVPGHEYVGTVAEVGRGVSDNLLSTRVSAYFYLTCGTCSHCLAGNDARCANLAGWVGVHRDGGYAPWAVLPAHNAVELPEGLDPVAATVVSDAVATPVHVATRAAIRPDDRVAVIGAGGGVGIHMVQVAQLFGGQVAGLDLTEEKLTAIEAHGAIPVRADNMTELGGQLWRDGGPTVVIDLVGSNATLRWSVDALAMGGRLAVLTTFRDRAMKLDPRDLVFRELSVLGSRHASRAEVAQAGRLVASGQIEPVIGNVVGPDGVADVHEQLLAGGLLGRGALSWEGHDADG